MTARNSSNRQVGVRLLLAGAEAELLRDRLDELDRALATTEALRARGRTPDPLLVALAELAASAVRVWLHQDAETLRIGFREATSK